MPPLFASMMLAAGCAPHAVPPVPVDPGAKIDVSEGPIQGMRALYVDPLRFVTHVEPTQSTGTAATTTATLHVTSIHDVRVTVAIAGYEIGTLDPRGDATLTGVKPGVYDVRWTLPDGAHWVEAVPTEPTGPDQPR